MKKNNPSQILKDKQDKLNWQQFNFLENLLVFCPSPARQVDKESGVHFRINLDPNVKSICILFKIDRDKDKKDPLVRKTRNVKEDEKKPDYMSLYIDQDSCICTIIEMKGINSDSLKRGVEQILKLKDILKQEIDNHLTTKLKIKFQGILLAPVNADIPLQKINEVFDSDKFVILPIECNHKAELYPYISKINKTPKIEKIITQNKQNKNINQTEPLLIETILTTRALPKRITRNYSNKEEEIYIDYLLPNDNDCITLWSHSNIIQIILRENEDKETIISEIEELNLKRFSLSIDTI